MCRIVFLAFCLFVVSACNPGDLVHERYVQNNCANDTIIVRNPDFDDAIDTIPPGENALIYQFKILDTKQEFEPCKWLGDSLYIYQFDDTYSTRSTKVESHWTYTIIGDKERRQTCTFVVTDDDF